MNGALGLIHPTGRAQPFLGLLLELGAYFEAFGGSFLLQILTTGTSRLDQSDEYTGDDDEHRGASNNDEEAVGRAGRYFGRHISWSV
jgi:hypothetical protein